MEDNGHLQEVGDQSRHHLQHRPPEARLHLHAFRGTGNQTIIDPVAQVEKLAQLLEKDLITRDEFDKKKREILGL